MAISLFAKLRNFEFLVDYCLLMLILMMFSNDVLHRELSDDLGQPVNCISMSNDGNCILASCLDSTIRLIDR